MAEMQKIRTGLHCTCVRHVHFVLVTEFRHKVFTGTHLARMEKIMRSVCTHFGCELVEFNGEDNHIHLRVNFPPEAAVTKLVSSPRGVPPAACAWGYPRSEAEGELPDLARHYWRANKPWSGSYFAATAGGAALAVARKYIEQQNRPGGAPPGPAVRSPRDAPRRRRGTVVSGTAGSKPATLRVATARFTSPPARRPVYYE